MNEGHQYAEAARPREPVSMLQDMPPACSLRIEPKSAQLSLIIYDSLDGRELVKLQELCGQNLDVRYHEGELEVFCPSLTALNESRHAPPGERFRDACR
jgi:hypothetical protein